MKAENFKNNEFGSAQTDSKGVVWFDPAPLPRKLRIHPETQIALSKADAAVGRLDGIAQVLPNPNLIAGPYAAREAFASSRIEGTHATLTDVYENEASRARQFDEHISAIQGHTDALWFGLEAVRDNPPLTLEMLLQVHRVLMKYDRQSQFSGRWREEEVYVGSPTGGPHAATYVPPPHDRVATLMEDWAEWHRNPPRLPLLIRIGLLHYQFLTIHPFKDGNGRLGRMLTQMMLEEERALSQPLLYVSAYLADNRREYYDRLQDVRELGEIQQWLQFFLTAVHVQAEDGVTRALNLVNLHASYRDRLAGSRSRAPELIDMLFEHPFISAARVQQKLGVSNPGALNLLRSLERSAILEPMRAPRPGRAAHWYAPEILDLIEGGAPAERDLPE